MFRLILVFFISLISFSQENEIDNSFFSGFELSNIGSSFVSYIPQFSSKNLQIKPDFMDNRLVENYKKYRLLDKKFFFSNFDIKNNLTYISGYNEGGFISSQLTRPISNHSHINFYYNNLISSGFFKFQENRYSNLGFEYAYFSEEKPYSFFVFFNSINGFYEENGGVLDYDQNLSDDLQQTHFSNANLELKMRNFSWDQFYKFNSGKMISYNLEYNSYKRVFLDTSPNSYHYNFHPEILSGLSSSIIVNYGNYSNYYNLKNKFTFHSNYFLEKNIDFAFIYNLYYHELISTNSGDMIFSVSNFKNPLDNKYKFSFNFCPSGYNKNNYDFKFLYTYNWKIISGEYSFGIYKNKPNLFSEIFSSNLNWEDDINSLKTFFLTLENAIFDKKIDFNINYRRINNFLYYDNYASVNQFPQAIDYFHFLLQKKWGGKKLLIHQNIHVQKSFFDNKNSYDILSTPLFLFHQSIKYNFDLFQETELRINFDFKIHSNYYPNSYMPLSSIFYTQNQIRVGMIPFFSAGLFLNKKNFSLGVLFNDIQYTFLERDYLIQDYIANPTNLSLYINWNFLD